MLISDTRETEKYGCVKVYPFLNEGDPIRIAGYFQVTEEGVTPHIAILKPLNATEQRQFIEAFQEANKIFILWRGVTYVEFARNE